MRWMIRVALLAALVTTTTPAEAGKRRPPLIVAVDKGDGAKVAKLLKRAKPRDLDAFDDAPGSPTAGLRAIEVAARRGDAALVDALLAAGATATARALEAAADGGQLAIATRLVERGAPRADLALTAAAKAGHADVVAALLPAARAADRYFNLDQVLEFAVYFPPRPSVAVVELLLRERANPAIGWGPGAHTVLHMAVAKGALDVMSEDEDVPVLRSQLGLRSAYRECQVMGATVHSVPRAGAAVAEVEGLVDEILKVMK